MKTLLQSEYAERYIGWWAGNISIKKWEIYYFKIKIIPFIVNLRRNYSKIKIINMILCSKWGLSILSKSSKYLEVESNASSPKRSFSIRWICLIQLKFSRIYLTYYLLRIRISILSKSSNVWKWSKKLQWYQFNYCLTETHEVSLITKQKQICNKRSTISTHWNTYNMTI